MMQFRTCLRFGAVSSMFVALATTIAKLCSVRDRSTFRDMASKGSRVGAGGGAEVRGDLQTNSSRSKGIQLT